MPHLISADGRSAIFPAGYRHHMGHDGADSWFLYVDADVFFNIAAHACPLFWEFEWGQGGSIACIGLRHRDRFASGQPGGLPSDLFTHRESRYGSYVQLTPIPAPALAHRVTTALLDAALLWTRETGSVCEILSSGLPPPRRRGRRRRSPGQRRYGLRAATPAACSTGALPPQRHSTTPSAIVPFAVATMNRSSRRRGGSNA
jgi:hypothetical protein